MGEMYFVPIKAAINRCLDYIEKGGSDMSDILSGYPSLDKLTRGFGPVFLILRLKTVENLSI